MIEPILVTYLLRICGALEIADAEKRRRAAGRIRHDLHQMTESGTTKKEAAIASPSPLSNNK